MPRRPAARPLRLLIVDDDESLVRLMTMRLQSAGHTVFAATGGHEALSLLRQNPVDLVMLDVMMPVMDGFSTLQAMREISDAPVVVMTALSDRSSIETAFSLGADDYIVKAQTDGDLIDRLDQLAGQILPARAGALHLSAGCFSLNLATDLLELEGHTIPLTPIEARLLERLLATPGRPVSIEDLYRAGWEEDPNPRARRVQLADRAIRQLRDKIEPEPARPRYLTVVEGVGYQLNPGQQAGPPLAS